MASGKVHALASIAAAVPCGIGVGWWTGDASAGMWAAVGCGVVGILLSPDLDMAQEITESERLVIKRLGPLGLLWTLLFWPYGLLFKHRGISHVPLIGTATRLLYLGGLFFILAKWQDWQITIPYQGWPAVVGLMASDILHWLMDGFPI